MIKPRKNPLEKIPPEYSQEILTRLNEDIYKHLQSGSDELDNFSGDTNKRLRKVEDKIASIEQKNNQDSVKRSSGIPIPSNLNVVKLNALPIVVSWCDPIDIIKYPTVEGVQFFGSVEKNFKPLIQSAILTYTGTCGQTHATNMVVTATENSKFLNTYTDLPFFADMNLDSGTVAITNTTQDTTGTITDWSALDALTLSTSISWTDGDNYRFEISRPCNMIGQGPLPFAIHFMPWDTHRGANPQYDGESFYAKARSYGRNGYSAFTCASSTDEAGELGAPTVTATPVFISNEIHVTWTMGVDFIDWLFELQTYKVYRTTANTTALISDDTYLVHSGKFGFYVDKVAEGNIEENKTYYYWVKPVAKDGTSWPAGSDNAKLGIPNDPVIYEGVEEGTTGFLIFKNWTIRWTCTDGCEGFWVRHQLKTNGTYLPWSLPIYIPYSTDNGLHGGDYIQEFTYLALLINETYKFGVTATNNALLPTMNSNEDTQDYTITDSGSPDPPT